MLADDIVLIATSKKILQQNLRIDQEEIRRMNIEINRNKTNAMVMTAEEQKNLHTIAGGVLEQVRSYNYLWTYCFSSWVTTKLR